MIIDTTSVATHPLPPLLIDLQLNGKEAFAGAWFPITVTLKCPTDHSGAVRIRNVDTMDKGIEIDSDLLQRDVKVRPGETYRFTLLVRVSTARAIDLSQIQIELASAAAHEVFGLSKEQIQIRPSLAGDIQVEEDPICTYGDVTKMQLRLKHTGKTNYRKLRVHLGPDGALRAGKDLLQFDEFLPQQEETLQVAVTRDFDLNMTAVVDGASVEASKTIRIKPVVQRASVPYRFLEPRRLATDRVIIRDPERADEIVPMVRMTHALRGGASYQVAVRTGEPGVKCIKMHDIPGKVYVRRSQRDHGKNEWTFDIDVAFADLFSQPERLVYEVESDGGPLTGEIHLTLQPPRLRHWHFAFVLGITGTLQGAAALTRRIFDPDVQLDELFSHFRMDRDYPLFFLGLIPVAWLIVVGVDWLQTRVRH